MKTKKLLLKTKATLILILLVWCWGVTAQICIRPIITVQPVSTSVCVGNVSLFTVVALGTNLSYQWQVNSGSGFTNCSNGGVYSGALTATLGVSGALILNGNQYRCIVSNSCGSATSSLCILTILSPNVTASASPASICVGASSTLTASGANSYQWSTGQTGSTITVTPGVTTTYSVTGTNLLGCSKTATVTVTVNPKPTVTASASPTSICTGASSTLTASGAFSYQWSTGETTSSIVVNPTSTTTYSVTGTSKFGCSKSAFVTVTVNPSPGVTAYALPSSICSGASSTLTANGANTYIWSTGQTGSSITVSPGETTSYSVTGTNEVGCSGTAAVTVSVNSSPTISIVASDPNICSGGFTFLTAGGATNYLWSTGETGSQIGVTATQTSTYSVTGMNDNGCSGSASYTITIGPDVTITASNPEVCSGGFTVLTASGATTYQWSTGETGEQIGVNPNQTTTYSVTGTNDQGCSSTAEFTVTVVSLPVSIVASDPDLCPGEFTFLTASGASDYLWSTGETGSQIGTTPPETTTYSVTGTNSDGCSGSASITVNVDQANCGAPSGRISGTQKVETNYTGAYSATKDELAIYPNPTKGVFTINGSPVDATIEIFNSRGERVILRTIGEGKEIDLAPYSKGLYFIKVKHQGVSIYQTRLYKE